MIGKCLCGEIQFNIEGDVANLYQCHCSLCRKQGGSSSNTATFVHQDKFSWLSGTDKISHYRKASGFTSDFCSVCGSTVPNRLRITDKFWIPAGLLEQPDDQKIVVHIYTASKAPWEQIPDKGLHFEEMPDFETLDRALQRS